MLVLSRKIGEIVTIGSSVRIKVLSFDRGVVRLGIEAPKTIPVHRKEVYDKIIEMNRQASRTGFNALKNVLSTSKFGLSDSNADRLIPPTVLLTKKAKADKQA